MKKTKVEDLSRRGFLCAAPLAAAAGLVLADAKLFAAQAGAPAGVWFVPNAFQSFPAETIASDCKELEGTSGSTSLIQNTNFTVGITSETAKTAPEYEWHAGRDHIIQILEGETVYEVGGTPINARNVKQGEWLAPSREDGATIHMKKGDMLVLPRGTLHRRITAGSVILTLIAPMGTAQA